MERRLQNYPMKDLPLLPNVADLRCNTIGVCAARSCFIRPVSIWSEDCDTVLAEAVLNLFHGTAAQVL
jgi:hypothetical protein